VGKIEAESAAMMDTIKSLREGIDPYDIPTAEKIMDMAAAEIERLTERRDSLARSCASYAVENERLRSELAIRAEWFEQMGHPGMAQATRAACKLN
jgi:hypothetical protein